MGQGSNYNQKEFDDFFRGAETQALPQPDFAAAPAPQQASNYQNNNYNRGYNNYNSPQPVATPNYNNSYGNNFGCQETQAIEAPDFNNFDPRNPIKQNQVIYENGCENDDDFGCAATQAIEAPDFSNVIVKQPEAMMKTCDTSAAFEQPEIFRKQQAGFSSPGYSNPQNHWQQKQPWQNVSPQTYRQDHGSAKYLVYVVIIALLLLVIVILIALITNA